jgi:hypothetical protein
MSSKVCASSTRAQYKISFNTRNDMTEFSLPEEEELEIYKIVRELVYQRTKKSFGWDECQLKYKTCYLIHSKAI